MTTSLSFIRKLYLAAGLIWGGIFGIISAFYIGGGAAGLFWIFIFGDNTWPEWAWGVVYTLSAIAGLLVFSTCFFIGWSYSKRIAGQSYDHKNEFGKAVFVLSSSLVVVFAYVSFNHHTEEEARLLTKAIQEEHERRLEDASPNKKYGESDLDYYCRVVRKQSKIEIMYQGQSLKIVPEALLSDRKLLFSISGPYNFIKSLADEISITDDTALGNKVLAPEFVALPENIRCGKEMYFISSVTPYLPRSLDTVDRVECFIPSARLGFTMKIRKGG